VVLETLKNIELYGRTSSDLTMATRPNILMFHVDNVSVGDFGCYGARIRSAPRPPTSIDSPVTACS
jgi:hypothetical protein